MNEKLIEEAIEIIKQISEEEDYQELIPGRYGTSENYPRYTGKKKEVIVLAISTLQNYLSAIKGGVPEERKCEHKWITNWTGEGVKNQDIYLHCEKCGIDKVSPFIDANNQWVYDKGFNTCRSQMLALLVEKDRELKQVQDLYLKLSKDFADQEKEIEELKDKIEFITDCNSELQRQLFRLRAIGVEEIRQIIIDKELTPSICRDSGQAEWGVEESRKLAQTIVALYKQKEKNE